MMKLRNGRLGACLRRRRRGRNDGDGDGDGEGEGEKGGNISDIAGDDIRVFSSFPQSPFCSSDFIMPSLSTRYVP